MEKILDNNRVRASDGSKIKPGSLEKNKNLFSLFYPRFFSPSQHNFDTIPTYGFLVLIT